MAGHIRQVRKNIRYNLFLIVYWKFEMLWML